MLSCRLAYGPLWLGIYPFLWWFLLVSFGLFLLHWRYELPCQDKLPEFHCIPILGCIRVLWLVFHPLGLGLDKALCGWNSVMNHCLATGKSLTGCLHFINKTPVDWYSKKQATDSRDSHIWFRICCYQNSNRTDHGH